MKGWLLNTNVVSALINPRGAPSVKTWASAQDEETFYISVLTLAEYDKGIHNLPADHEDQNGEYPHPLRGSGDSGPGLSLPRGRGPSR